MLIGLHCIVFLCLLTLLFRQFATLKNVLEALLRDYRGRRSLLPLAGCTTSDAFDHIFEFVRQARAYGSRSWLLEVFLSIDRRNTQANSGFGFLARLT